MARHITLPAQHRVMLHFLNIVEGTLHIEALDTGCDATVLDATHVQLSAGALPCVSSIRVHADVQWDAQYTYTVDELLLITVQGPHAAVLEMTISEPELAAQASPPHSHPKRAARKTAR